MISFLFSGLLGIGYLTLAFGWTRSAYWQVSLFLLLLAPLSLYLVKRKIAYAADLFLILGVIAAAIGLSLGLPFPYALGGCVFLWAAWDLEHFNRRLAFAAPADEPALKVRQHSLQLALIILLGLGGSLLTLNLRFKFNFEQTIFLVVLVFASLVVLINWLRKTER